MDLGLGSGWLGWSPLNPSAFAMMMQGTECVVVLRSCCGENGHKQGGARLQLQWPAVAHFEGFRLLRGRLPQCRGGERSTRFNNWIGPSLGIWQRNPNNEVRLCTPSKTIFILSLTMLEGPSLSGFRLESENSHVIWDWISICSLWQHFGDLYVTHKCSTCMRCPAFLYSSH